MDTFYVLLLIFLTHAQNSVLHAGRCRSVLESDEVRVTCLHANFTRLPSESFPNNTTNLNVRFSNLSSVVLDDLKRFPHLSGLHLLRNQLDTLPADLLEGLSSLHVLDLTGTA